MTRRAAALVALAAAWLAPACCAASERPAPSPARAAAAAVESTAIPTAIVDAPIPAATPAPANASLLRPAKLRATFRVPRAATPLYIGTPWFVRDLTATITGPGGRRDTLPATAGLPGHMLGLRLPADAWQADRIDIDATTVSTAAPPYLLTAEQLALIGWRNWPYAALFGLFAALALLAAGLALTRRSAAAGWYAVAAAAQAGLLVPWLGVVRPPPELSQPLHAALQSAVFIALTAFTLAYLRSIRLARSTTTIVWMLVALNVLAAAAGDVLQDLYPLPDLATQAFVAALQLAYVALGITAARNTIPGAWCYLTATSLAALGSLTGAVPSLPAEVQQWTPPAGAAIEALLLALALIALVTRPAAKRTHGEEAADIAHRRTQPDEIEIAPEHDRTPAHRPAHLDGLTEIPNRTALEEHLATAWEHARATQTPLAAMLVDIDHFQKYNATYGHLAGDDILRRIAAALTTATTGATDITGRYAADKFLALLGDTDIAGARRIADAARAAVNALDLAHGAVPSKRVTVSIGLAAITPQPTRTDMAAPPTPALGAPPATTTAAVAPVAPGELLRRASSALLVAKTLGRNRVVADEPIAPPVALR